MKNTNIKYYGFSLVLSVIFLSLFSILPSCGGGGGGGGGAQYSNATLAGVWLVKSTVGSDTIVDSLEFDGNGNMVESYLLNPGALPAPYNVQADGSVTYYMTFASDPTITVTGKLTSATTGWGTAVVSGATMTGSMRKVMDLGACQGTWSGQLAGGHTNSFQLIVNNTGTITGGSGFASPISGKLFCESGDASGLVVTNAAWPMNRMKFNNGTVVSGAMVTISGNYETNSGNGTYTLVK